MCIKRFTLGEKETDADKDNTCNDGGDAAYLFSSSF
jgi:hypothetical protein